MKKRKCYCSLIHLHYNIACFYITTYFPAPSLIIYEDKHYYLPVFALYPAQKPKHRYCGIQYIASNIPRPQTPRSVGREKRKDTMDREGGTNQSEWRRTIMTLQNYCLLTSRTTQRYSRTWEARLDTTEYIIIHMKLATREMQSHVAATLECMYGSRKIKNMIYARATSLFNVFVKLGLPT